MDNPLVESISLALASWSALEKGEATSAFEAARRLRDPPASVTGTSRTEIVLLADLLAGVALARAGDLGPARALHESQAYDSGDATQKWLHYALAGELALAEGNLSAAEAAFTQGFPKVRMLWRTLDAFRGVVANNLFSRDGLARIRRAQGSPAAAIEIYRRLNTTDVSSGWTAALEPRYVLELARSLDQAGDPEGARDMDSITVGSDGRVYIIDQDGQAVIRFDPQTEQITVLVTSAGLSAALQGGDALALEKGIAAGADGLMYAFNEAGPAAVYAVCSDGTTEIIAREGLIRDPDKFATRAPDGDIIISDDFGSDPRLLRMTPEGEVSVFLSNAQLGAATGTAVERLDGGIAFDADGSFYLAERDSGGILRFDQGGNGAVWVTRATIVAATGIDPALRGGIAFEPEYKLYFAQFGDGLGVLASEIILVSLDPENPTTADLILKRQDGGPLSVDLNGDEVVGELHDVVVPADGKVVLETDGEGDLVVGSVTVCSNLPLAGVIVFSGPVGLAGVQSSEALVHFAAPIKALGNDIRTGMAIMNLEAVAVRLTLELVGEDGELVAGAEIILDAMGQLSAFVDETEKFPWDRAVDFSNFEGTLRAWADGWVAATVVQTRPDQFATQPVAEIKEKEMP